MLMAVLGLKQLSEIQAQNNWQGMITGLMPK